MKHRKKVLKKYADLHLSGFKDWEIRKNDCNYTAGDIIEFTVVNEDLEPTGETYEREIVYVYEGLDYGLKEGHCIMSLKKIS